MKKSTITAFVLYFILGQTLLSYGMDTSQDPEIQALQAEMQKILATRELDFTPSNPERFTRYQDFRCAPMWQTRAIKDDPDGTQPKSIFTTGANGCVIFGFYSQKGKHQTAILSHNPPIPNADFFKKIRKKTKLWLGKKNRHVIVLTQDISNLPTQDHIIQSLILKTFVHQTLKSIKIDPDGNNVHHLTYSNKRPEFNDFEIVLDPNPLLSHCTDKDGRRIEFNQEA